MRGMIKEGRALPTTALHRLPTTDGDCGGAEGRGVSGGGERNRKWTDTIYAIGRDVDEQLIIWSLNEVVAGRRRSRRCRKPAADHLDQFPFKGIGATLTYYIR